MSSEEATSQGYLPPGLPIPVPERNGLSAPFWDGLKQGRIRVQRNPATGVFQSIERGDVRMIQRGQDLGFALESRHALGVGGEFRGQVTTAGPSGPAKI